MEAASITVPSVPRLRRGGLGASDPQLVQRVRAGDERAFELVFDRYQAPLLSFCRHMLGSREEAEDALQHVFVSAHRHLVSDDRAVELRPWLYAIARNRCLSVLRSRRESVALDDVAEPSTAGLAVANEVEQREDLQELLTDLARLPDQQRAALVLSELDALSHDEIADVLGVRRDKVKALVFQARESLGGWRQARRTDCAEIREQLATLRGGALRRGPLRKHLDTCQSCREFRGEVHRQREAMALLLPVVPSVALKAKVFGAIAANAVGHAAAGAGVAGGAAGLAGVAGSGSAAALPAGSGAVAVLGGGAAAKVAVVAAIAAVAGGGYEVAHHHAVRTHARPTAAHVQPVQPGGSASGATPVSISASGAPTPVAGGAPGGLTGIARAQAAPGAAHRSDRAAQELARHQAAKHTGRPQSLPGAHGNGNGKAVAKGHGQAHHTHAKGGSLQALAKKVDRHSRHSAAHHAHRVRPHHATHPVKPVAPAHPVKPVTPTAPAPSSSSSTDSTGTNRGNHGVVGAIVGQHNRVKLAPQG